MKRPNFDEQERSRLLAERERLIKEYATAKQALRALDAEQGSDLGRRQALLHEMQTLAAGLEANRELYDDIIPRIKLSQCPFSGEPLIIAFDPVALDGLWWMEFTRRAYDREHRPRTFRVLRGAVALGSVPAGGGRHQALLGPGVPYVIPRILELPSMVMVISQIRLASGHIAYPLAYFSSQDPPPGQLTSAWLEKNQYYFTDENGRTGWMLACDPWDFDIAAWVEKGKIRWIPPDGDGLAPASTQPSDCPYCDLDGLRLPQIVEGDQVFTEPLPQPGMDQDLFD